MRFKQSEIEKPSHQLIELIRVNYTFQDRANRVTKFHISISDATLRWILWRSC